MHPVFKSTVHPDIDSTNRPCSTAVVESVRDGGTLRLMLIPSMNYITLMLTGIRCPSFKPDGGSEDHADEVRGSGFLEGWWRPTPDSYWKQFLQLIFTVLPVAFFYFFFIFFLLLYEGCDKWECNVKNDHYRLYNISLHWNKLSYMKFGSRNFGSTTGVYHLDGIFRFFTSFRTLFTILITYAKSLIMTLIPIEWCSIRCLAYTTRIVC